MTDSSHAPDAHPIDPAVEAALAASREARIESLLEIARIPSVSALHEHAPDMVATAEWIADRLRRARRDRGRGDRDRPAPDRLRPDPRGARRADGHRLLPLRRPARRPARPVGAPAVRAVRARRPVRRARRGRRQGPARDAPRRDRGAARGRPGARGQPHVRVRGRGGVRVARASRRGSPSTATASPRTPSIISDTGFFEGNVPAITVGLRGIMYAQIDVELSPVDLHSGAYGGTVQNPANALARSSRRSRAPTAGSASRASTTTSSRSRPPSARRWPRCRSTTRRSGPRSRCPSSSARPAGRRSSASPRARRSTSTACGAASRARARKTIIPAHAHAKLSARLVANQDPDKVFDGLRDHVAAVAPPGVTVTHAARSTAASRASRRATTRRPAPRLGRIEAVYGVEPVFIREGGSIPVTAVFEHDLGPAGRAARASPSRPSNAHAPNEWLLVENFERGTRVIVRLWDELGGRRREPVWPPPGRAEHRDSGQYVRVISGTVSGHCAPKTRC